MIQKKNVLALVIVFFILNSIQVLAIGAVQTTTGVYNLTMQVSGGNVSTSVADIQATVGEWAIGNATLAGSFQVLVGYLYTINTSFDGSSNVTGPCTENWIITGWQENTTHISRILNDSNNCGTSNDKPVEVERRLAFWEAAIALFYIGAVALYVVYGFTIRDKNADNFGGGSLLNPKIMGAMLTGLKYLYLLSAPALFLLGIHIAREIAIDAGAAASITDSLMTAFQVLAGIYVMTLLMFMIVIITRSVSTLSETASESLNVFRNKRRGRN